MKDLEAWDRYVFMFEDCVFEIYEGMGADYSTREVFEEIGAPARRRLEVCLYISLPTLLCFTTRFERFATRSFAAATISKKLLRRFRSRKWTRFLRGG